MCGSRDQKRMFIKSMIVLIFMYLQGNSLFSSPDTSIVFHPNQYFVELDSLIPEDTLQVMLADLNSIEVWSDEDINLAVWQVIDFPFTNSEGETIFDINRVITTAKKKTKISSSSLNVQHVIDLSTSENDNGCFDINQFSAELGDETIMISILDTGISDITDNSTADFNYNLSNYSGYDYVRDDDIPDDEHGHGTHLAGLIYSITHSISLDNVTTTFDIRKTHDSLGQAYTSNVVFALLDAIDAGADIVNMSFSVQDIYHDTLFFPLKQALIEAEQEGVLVISSAGNQSNNNDNMLSTALPASFPLKNIISVGAVDCSNSLSTFSNYGSNSVDVMILGESIPGPDLGANISFISGTSQAAAIITGVAGILASNQIEFNVEQIKCGLLRNSKHYTRLHDLSLSNGVTDVTTIFSDNFEQCILPFNQCQSDFVGDEAFGGSPSQHFLSETNGRIESSHQISFNGEVTYDALNGISLLSEFELLKGGLFQIQTNGCEGIEDP